MGLRKTFDSKVSTSISIGDSLNTFHPLCKHTITNVDRMLFPDYHISIYI
jgi:hypothetical protein